MNGKIKIVIAILFVIITIAGCADSPTGEIARDQAIKIGFIGPLTGDVAGWGISAKNGLEIAIESINSQGGVNGNMIHAIYEDGKCTAKDGVLAAQKLVNIDKVDVIFTSCSSEALAIAPITEEKGIIHFSVATHKDVPESGEFVFRTSYSDEDSARAAVETILEKHTKVGVLYEQTSYPEGIKNAFVRNFGAKGGKVFVEGFPQGAADMRTQITKLLSKDIDAVFLDPDGPHGGVAALQQLRAMGFDGDIYGNYFAGNQEVHKIPEADGMIFFADPVVKENSLKQEIFKMYLAKYGELPSFEITTAAAYDGMYILEKAFESAGKDSVGVKQYLHEMDDYTGLMGTFGFDKDGEIVGVQPVVKVIHNNTASEYQG